MAANGCTLAYSERGDSLELLTRQPGAAGTSHVRCTPLSTRTSGYLYFYMAYCTRVTRLGGGATAHPTHVFVGSLGGLWETLLDDVAQFASGVLRLPADVLGATGLDGDGRTYVSRMRTLWLAAAVARSSDRHPATAVVAACTRAGIGLSVEHRKYNTSIQSLRDTFRAAREVLPVRQPAGVARDPVWQMGGVYTPAVRGVARLYGELLASGRTGSILKGFTVDPLVPRVPGERLAPVYVRQDVYSEEYKQHLLGQPSVEQYLTRRRNDQRRQLALRPPPRPPSARLAQRRRLRSG
jgi:hypothetical protein